MFLFKPISLLKVCLASLPFLFAACVHRPAPVPLGVAEELPSIRVLAGWPETFGDYVPKTNGYEAYQPAPAVEGLDAAVELPSGPALIHGVTIIRNDLLKDYIREKAVSASFLGMDFGEQKDQENRTVVQNISGEILYLVPEETVEPVVLVPGYTALNIDGFVSAVQYNKDVGNNYYKVIPGILAKYEGGGKVNTGGFFLVRALGDLLNSFDKKESSGWIEEIPFTGFRGELESLGVLKVR